MLPLVGSRSTTNAVAGFVDDLGHMTPGYRLMRHGIDDVVDA